MITIKLAKNKEAAVRYFYEQEGEEFHQEVHENGGTVDQNVADTIKTISENAVMYEVWENEMLAASFTRYEDEFGNLAMEFFHVLKLFRNKEFLIMFWRLVKETFGGAFWIGVYQQNEVAIKHLYQQGFEMTGSTYHKNKAIYIFKTK